MITQNVSTLKIHKLTKEQYDRELAAGRIDPNALYFTTTNEEDYTIKDELAAIEERVAALEAAVAMLRTLGASEA